MLLRQIGIDVNDANALIDEDAIVSLSVLNELESLGVLAKAYHGAITIAGENSVLREKAAHYQRRFEIASRAAVVLIDTDGDGLADAERRMGDICLIRV